MQEHAVMDKKSTKNKVKEGGGKKKKGGGQL